MSIGWWIALSVLCLLGLWIAAYVISSGWHSAKQQSWRQSLADLVKRNRNQGG